MSEYLKNIWRIQPIPTIKSFVLRSVGKAFWPKPKDIPTEIHVLFDTPIQGVSVVDHIPTPDQEVYRLYWFGQRLWNELQKRLEVRALRDTALYQFIVENSVLKGLHPNGWPFNHSELKHQYYWYKKETSIFDEMFPGTSQEVALAFINGRQSLGYLYIRPCFWNDLLRIFVAWFNLFSKVGLSIIELFTELCQLRNVAVMPFVDDYLDQYPKNKKHVEIAYVREWRPLVARYCDALGLEMPESRKMHQKYWRMFLGRLLDRGVLTEKQEAKW